MQILPHYRFCNRSLVIVMRFQNLEASERTCVCQASPHAVAVSSEVEVSPPPPTKRGSGGAMFVRATFKTSGEHAAVVALPDGASRA